MLVKAYELLLKCDKDIVFDVLSEFNACAAGVCEGQQYDMNFETINSVSEVEYINMIRLKTSVLLGFSLELGAILAKAPESMCTELYSIGCDLGIGFQLKDDLLDVYGDTEKFGKQVGGDIISNKKTYLLIKALELAEGADSEALNYWLKQEQFDATEKVSAVTKIYNNLGIQQLTEQKTRNYFDLGLKKFDELDINENNKTRLREFFYQLIEREK
jgi:geranylgeranyl diphosphate synthase type II